MARKKNGDGQQNQPRKDTEKKPVCQECGKTMRLYGAMWKCMTIHGRMR